MKIHFHPLSRPARGSFAPFFFHRFYLWTKAQFDMDFFPRRKSFLVHCKHSLSTTWLKTPSRRRRTSCLFLIIDHFHPDYNAPCLPPQILHYLLVVHNFSWVLQSFQEKSKTMVMHKVHYGLGENVKWPRSWSLDSWEQINIAVGAWLELWSFGSWVNRNDDLDKLFPVCFPDLATGRERQLTTGKRAERTKHDLRCSICRSTIGQASCLICARRRQLTFPFCC